jgi:endonuclease/exonuclease/phosphatase family metal-dependent hydrolase
VTLNFWGIEPPLDDRLALAERQLRELAPDIIAMQEVRPLNGLAGKTTAELLADELGMGMAYEVAVSWNDGEIPGRPAGSEGLAILSRHTIGKTMCAPLPEPRPADKRMLLSVRIESPNGPVWCHTTHLHYRLDDGLARERQVARIDQLVSGIDTSAPQILCGDFNADPDSDEIRFLRGRTTLDGRRTN